ncbi:helix-turn-helix domain-containing protein [Embleya sp. MST-111070]|uniref:helix-turn-helix domain-containing protein n=1 Tax=Embleya sp. MST-111070 TaxID=3398231 RepID=UPI003F732230
MARQPVDEDEKKRILRLAGARHAPADWILRARIVALNWEGLRVPRAAARAGCDAKTVRRWLPRVAMTTTVPRCPASGARTLLPPPNTHGR